MVSHTPPDTTQALIPGPQLPATGESSSPSSPLPTALQIDRAIQEINQRAAMPTEGVVKTEPIAEGKQRRSQFVIELSPPRKSPCEACAAKEDDV